MNELKTNHLYTKEELNTLGYISRYDSLMSDGTYLYTLSLNNKPMYLATLAKDNTFMVVSKIS